MNSRYKFFIACVVAFAANSFPWMAAVVTASQRGEEIESVEQAQQLIKNYRGKPQNFQLVISLSKPLLLHGKPVPMDAAMALITDNILAKGWLPNGFTDKHHVRYYHYSR